MFCKSCGKEMESDAIFCKNCGQEVSKELQGKDTNNKNATKGETNKVEINITGIQQAFSGRITASTVWGCIIGLVLFVGAFLPWVTAKMSLFGASSSYSAPGTKLQSYGTWVIITGVLCAVMSFVIQKKYRAWGFIVLGLISAIDVIVFFVNFNSELGTVTGYSSLLGGFDVSKGIGMWICMVGAIGAITFGVLELRKTAKEDYPPIK